MIYLDNAATTYPKPDEVYQEVITTMKEKGANPGRGAYKMALEAARVIYNTRSTIAEFLGADKPENIVFTSNATEAINLALKGILTSGDHVITTSMEHNSVIRPLKYLETQNVKITIIQANEQGIVSPKEIERAITKDTKLIFVSHASNVCGSITPVEEIGRIANEKGIYFGIDAAQSIGYIPIDVKNLNLDILAFPGHKGLYGPVGTGGLYIKQGIILKPLKEGGTGISSKSEQMPENTPERYESGTLNVPGIAGLGAGIRYIKKTGLQHIMKKGQDLLSYIISELQKIQGLKIYGPLYGSRVPVISFNLPNLDAAEAALFLDRRYDIAVRSGLHCSPLAHNTLGTINTGTIRASLSFFNTEQEIEALISAVKELAEM